MSLHCFYYFVLSLYVANQQATHNIIIVVGKTHLRPCRCRAGSETRNEKSPDVSRLARVHRREPTGRRCSRASRRAHAAVPRATADRPEQTRACNVVRVHCINTVRWPM